MTCSPHGTTWEWPGVGRRNGPTKFIIDPDVQRRLRETGLDGIGIEPEAESKRGPKGLGHFETIFRPRVECAPNSAPFRRFMKDG